MNTDISIGDRVKLLGVPDWLVHDLPADEKAEILGCVGKVAVISEIDSHGYFWIGFGSTSEDADGADYAGHSFCVSREYLQKV